MGHALGLVNNGLPLTSAHQDAPNTVLIARTRAVPCIGKTGGGP